MAKKPTSHIEANLTFLPLAFGGLFGLYFLLRTHMRMKIATSFSVHIIAETAETLAESSAALPYHFIGPPPGKFCDTIRT